MRPEARRQPGWNIVITVRPSYGCPWSCTSYPRISNSQHSARRSIGLRGNNILSGRCPKTVLTFASSSFTALTAFGVAAITSEVLSVALLSWTIPFLAVVASCAVYLPSARSYAALTAFDVAAISSDVLSIALLSCTSPLRDMVASTTSIASRALLCPRPFSAISPRFRSIRRKRPSPVATFNSTAAVSDTARRNCRLTLTPFSGFSMAAQFATEYSSPASVSRPTSLTTNPPTATGRTS